MLSSGEQNPSPHSSPGVPGRGLTWTTGSQSAGRSGHEGYQPRRTVSLDPFGAHHESPRNSSRFRQAEQTTHPASAEGAFDVGSEPAPVLDASVSPSCFWEPGPWQRAADDKPKPGKGDKPVPAEEAPKGGEKKFAFSFDNKPWTQVLEWFADNTKLAFVGNYKPAGTFTFVPPKVDGQLKTYTLRRDHRYSQ